MRLYSARNFSALSAIVFTRCVASQAIRSEQIYNSGVTNRAHDHEQTIKRKEARNWHRRRKVRSKNNGEVKILEHVQPEVIEQKKLNSQTYNWILRAYINARRMEEIKKMYAEMVYNNVHIELATLNSMIRALGEDGELEKMEEVLEFMNQQPETKPNSVTYFAMINAYGRAGRFDDVNRIRQQMTSSNIPISREMMNTMVHNYGMARDFQTMERLCEEMENTGLADCVTYNSMVKTYAQANRNDKISQLHNRLERSNSKKISNISFSMIVKNATTLAQVESAKQLALNSGVKLNIFSYQSLINAYQGKNDIQNALKTFSEMKRSNVAPDALTYVSLIYTHGRVGDFGRVSKLLREMNEKGIRPQFETFLALLVVYGAEGRFDDIDACLWQMQEAGCKLNQATGNMLIGVFAKGTRIEQMERIMKIMEEQNMTVPDSTKITIINAYAKVRDFEKMMQVQDVTLSYRYSFFNALANSGEVEKMEESFDYQNLTFCGNPCVNPSIYNIMIKAYGKAKQFEKMLLVFNQMRENNIPLSQITFCSLVSAYSIAGELEEMEKTFLLMKEHNVSVPLMVYTSMINAYSKSDRLDDVERMFEEISTARVKLDEPAYFAILQAYHKSERKDKLAHLFEYGKNNHLVREDAPSIENIITKYKRAPAFRKSLLRKKNKKGRL